MTDTPTEVYTPARVKCPVCKKDVRIGKYRQLFAHGPTKDRCKGSAGSNGFHGAELSYIYEATSIKTNMPFEVGDHFAYRYPYNGVEFKECFRTTTVKMKYLGTYVKYDGKRYNLEGEFDPGD